MKTLAMAALLAALTAPNLASAADEAVGGAWKVNGRVDGKDFVLNCHFDQHGQSFGGTCLDSNPDPKRTLTAGSIAGDQVKWTYKTHWGLLKFDVNYAGKLTGGAMRGTVAAAGKSGTFTAAKE